jgi:hypothetical protein
MRLERKDRLAGDLPVKTAGLYLTHAPSTTAIPIEPQTKIDLTTASQALGIITRIRGQGNGAPALPGISLTLSFYLAYNLEFL